MLNDIVTGLKELACLPERFVDNYFGIGKVYTHHSGETYLTFLLACCLLYTAPGNESYGNPAAIRAEPSRSVLSHNNTFATQSKSAGVV